MAMISAEPIREIFDAYCKGLEKQFTSKIYDNNTWKAFPLKGYERELVIGGHHRLTFLNILRSINQQEMVEQKGKKLMCLELRSLHRLEEVMPYSAFGRFHKNGDITVVSPWGILHEDFYVNDIKLAKMSYFVPIYENQEFLKLSFHVVDQILTPMNYLSI